MKAETVIKTLLESAAPVVQLAGQRIYLDARPEADPLPAVVFELISNRHDQPAFPGMGSELSTARIQVNCLARTAEEAVALREAVRTACHVQSGVIGGVTVMANLADISGPDSYDPLVYIYTKTIDFILRYLR
jgi:hypothetical protein